MEVIHLKRTFYCSQVVFAILLLAASAATMARAQSYHNVVNRRFATIGDGPQSALILDVKDAGDTAAVHQAALQKFRALLSSRRPALQRELAFMRRHRLVKSNVPFDFTTTILVRENGKLPAASRARLTRAPGGNTLTFNFPTTGTGAWDPSTVGDLQNLTNQVYAQVSQIMGPPLWNGTVNVLNLDPTLGKEDEPLGAVMIVNQNNVEIDFPTFSDTNTLVLALAQVVAQAFHGPYRLGYDAWELGMARAVAVVVGRTLLQPTSQFGESLGFYYTSDYDILNQPPLANNTFLPPSETSQPFNAATLSGMLIPRLQMASTAWLKVYIENSTFFSAFNAAYANAIATATQGAGVANNIPALVTLVNNIVPNVEMQPFFTWYAHQYVLDTSVTPGPKLYAYAEPTFPDTTSTPPTPAGAAVFLVYYQTTPAGDEQDLSGTVYPIYWDYTFSNRLNFQTGTSVIAISNGFGTVAPYFQNLGGSGSNPDEMRIAMDFPINNEYVRVYFPTAATGTEAQPSDFSGVVIGADSGTLGATFEGGGAETTPVAQGAFAASASNNVPSGFSKTQLLFTTSGSQPIQFQRNTAFNNTIGVAPIFQLVAPGQVVSLSHTFAAGPQMVSLPVRPLNTDLAAELGLTPGTALLAQWRGDTQIQANNPDQYMRYPSMPLYQPGYSFWSSLPAVVTTNVLGENMDVQQDVSVGLSYGWNQIGPPYSATVNVTTDLAFTDQGTLYPSLQTAQDPSNGIIAPGIFAFSSSGGYQDITSPSETGFPQNTLEPWQGYWIRVLVPEGVTLTYSTASSRAAHHGLRGGKATRVATAHPVRDPDVWRVPLTLQDEAGHTTTAVLGQSSRGADSFVPALDEASPPPFAGGATLGIRFPHPDWSTGFSPGGDFLTDIRRANTKSQWDVAVTVPAPNASYTLSWNGTATLPRNMHLTLVDTETGARQLMNSSSSYAFRAGSALTRHFQIVAEPHLAGHLFIRNVAVLTPRNTGGRAIRSMTISYELTADAEANIEILSAGRTVRHLVMGRAVTAGVNQMLWDLKDDQGRGLGTGTYLVSITARTPDGEQTRQVVPLLLTR